MFTNIESYFNHMCSDKTLNYGITVPNWAINMNVQANRTEKSNIYIKHNYRVIPFKFIIAKQYRLSLKLQLSGQISNFVQYGYKMWAEVGLCKRWLDYKSAQCQ